MDYSELEARIAAWVRTQPAIRGAVVIGSRARRAQTDHPADEWSDLDLILFTPTPDLYRTDPAWLNTIGEVWLAVEEDINSGDPEWLVLFEGWRKADFVFERISEELDRAGSLARIVAASRYQDVISRGVRPLASQPLEPLGESLHPTFPPLPGPEQFQAAVAFFLHDAARTAKLIHRKDLWRAQQELECGLKKRLLKMIEWQAQAGREQPVDTWYDGRYLTEWAGPETVQALPSTVAGFETESQWKALEHTLRLYRRMAESAARQLGYEYPAQVEARILSWIEQIRK